MEICDSTLFGQNALPYTKRFCGRTLGVVVDFTPTGLHTLWPLPLQEMSERSVDLTSAVTDDVRVLHDQLREARSTTARFAMVENFLLRRLACAQRTKRFRTDGRVEAAANYIQHNPGRVHLPQLAHYVNCSERTLRRRFTNAVGVCPKRYVRILRFMHARRWIERHPRPDWQDLLSALGYYDQAHLINEFQHFAGVFPQLYESESRGPHDLLYRIG
jgi:AraC-like DNA-binding protein